MAKFSLKSGAGGGLFLLGLLACGGALLYFAGRGFSKGKPVATEDSSFLQMVQAGSGVGDKSLTMFGCDLTGITKDSVASWIAFYQTGHPFEVRAYDDGGREWPIFSVAGRGHELCYIVPFGYDQAPRRLVAKVRDIQSNRTKDFLFPSLPSPRRYVLPKEQGAIPSLKLGVDRGWITVSADLPAGHALMGKPVAGELIGPIKAPFLQRVLPEGLKFSTGRFYPPVGPYAQTAQSMAFDFTEIKLVPHHVVVEFPPLDLVKQYGETWIRRGQVKVNLARGLDLILQSVVQIPYRQPRRRQTEFALRVRPTYSVDAGNVRGFNLLEPTTVAGLPVKAETRMNGIVPPEVQLIRTETGPAVGKLRVKMSVDFDTFVPIRTAIVHYRWPGLPMPKLPSHLGAPPIEGEMRPAKS